MARSIAQAPWPHPLRHAASLYGQQLAVITSGGQLTYQELLQAVQHQAGWLAQQGIQPGQCIGLHGPPTLAWVVTFHALGWLGAVACPLPWHPEGQAKGLATLLTSPDRLLCAPSSALLTHEKALPWPWGDGLDEREDHGCSSNRPIMAEPYGPITMEQPWLMLHSSGTTGTTRPIVHTFGALWLANAQSLMRLEHRRYDRWLCTLPLAFTGGISVMIRALLSATCVQLHHPFQADNVAALLESGTIHLLSLVPPMLEALLHVRGDQPFPAAVRAILIGGAPLSPSLRARARACAVPLAPTWGMTETFGQIATLPPQEAYCQEQGVGPALPCHQVTLQQGRLHIDGPILAEPLLSNDVGTIDALGHLQVLGRVDDVLLYGGQTLLPEPIEQCFATYPDVQYSLVLPWPHPRFHHVPVLLLLVKIQQPSQEPQWHVQTLLRWAHQQGATCLPRYLCLIPEPIWPEILQQAQDQLTWSKSGSGLSGKWRRKALLAWLQQHGLVCEQYILSGQTCTQWLWHHDGRLESRIGTTVDQLDVGNGTPVGVEQAVKASETALLGQHTLQTHVDRLTQTNRREIIGFRMDQGRGPQALGKGLVQVGENQTQQVLPRGMAIGEITGKIDNTRPIDVIKTGSESTCQGHQQHPQERHVVHTSFASRNKTLFSSFSH